LNRKDRNNLWIDPLLTQLKLVRKTEANTDLSSAWRKLEVAHLPDRVGRIASEINETAGYHLLDSLFYLGPQKNVLCVRFDRNRDKYNMEIVLIGNEVILRFSTTKHVSFNWERYFSSDSSSSNLTKVWEQVIQPEKILDEHIQGWLTYLLSRLSKEFRPDLFDSSSFAESDLNRVLRKASA
jgi:hypothetical protein